MSDQELLYTVDEIAQVCHEANRALQAVQLTHSATGVPVAPTWTEFPDDERAGVCEGVEVALAGATPEELHEAWCERKREQGWAHGTAKDATLRTHPALVSYDALPPEQLVKDELFSAVIVALGDVAFRPIETAGRHGSIASLARYFEFGHLPSHLVPISRMCAILARGMVSCLADGPELAAGLRKLLEAKDCFVRAALEVDRSA